MIFRSTRTNSVCVNLGLEQARYLAFGKNKRKNTARNNDETESPESRGVMLSLKRAQMKLPGGKRAGDGPEYSVKRK